jgi:hypothetical protein
MRTVLFPLVLLVWALLLAEPATAELTGVRAMPRQALLSAGRDNRVSVNWRVATTADHRSGVSSRSATVIDPTTGEILSTVATTFDAAAAGPFSFRETVFLDAGSVAEWVSAGIRQVLLVRSFGDAIGGTVEGTVVLRLGASQLQSARDPAPSALAVTALRLEFATGNNAALVDADESLQAIATLQYTGTGMLRGRWQIVEPESPAGVPAYRTLALVNKNLATSQRSILRSPVLPTRRPGRYLVRFCVTGQEGSGTAGDVHCPNPDLVAVASYRVQAGDGQRVDVITGLSPDRQQVDGTTVFSWRPSPRAQVYRLQVLGGDAEFVTGMVLNGATHETQLSDLVQRSLASGQRYTWRISAHDAAGQVVGESAEATFVYAPR